ncbi:TRAP transporter large permease subunit [bacterium]|nr:TRAP transporter large permease subunit [bacterium]
MSPEIITILMFAGLLIGIILGYPTAFVLGGLSMLFGLIFIGPEIFGFFIVRLLGLMKNYILLAVPLFLFMGVFMEKSGVAERLYSAMYLLLGGLRGGLAMATIVICMIFAAATGVVGASEVTIGLLALPAMLKRKFNVPLACGTICAGGTLGILIPPSIMIVMYGPTAGLSVGKLFMGAFIPGILLVLLYLVSIGIRCYFRPQDGPPMPLEERMVPISQKIKLLFTSILPPLFLIFAVLGTIFLGIAAVTEAAAMGAIASIILAAIYRQVTFQVIKEACKRTLQITSMILMIAVGAGFFTTTFVALGGGDVVNNFVLGLPFGKLGILFTMMTVLIILGMFIDWIGIVFIVVPIFTPIANELGFDPIWFALLVMVNLQISFLTPPFAYSIFYLKGITPPEVQTSDIYRGVLPFVGLQIVGLALCIIFPQLITFLPNLMIK